MNTIFPRHLLTLMALLLSLSGCSPMVSSPGMTDSASSSVPDKMTFQALERRYSRQRTSFQIVEHSINVAPEVVQQCAMGELDIINAAKPCGGDDQLIVTVRDEEQEKVIKRIDPKDPKALDSFEVDVQNVKARGEDLDIFVCLDGNNNGQCADEYVADINAASVKMVVQGVKGACDVVKDGAILFHHYEKMSVSSGKSYTVALQYDAVSEEAQLSLQNIAVPTVQSTETAPAKIPIRLAKSNPDACPPAVRTDGCFAKGTLIQMHDGSQMAIEDIKGNSAVKLADGRVALVNKIVSGPETEQVITFETADGQKITVTNKHPMMTARGVLMARDISISDKLQVAKTGKFTALANIRKHDYKEKVYNFELRGRTNEADHLVVANGLTTGELVLQNQLVQKSQPGKLALK